MTAPKQCRYCRFWVFQGLAGASELWSECRRRAPVFTPPPRQSEWPRTIGTDWCGEWEASPEAAEYIFGSGWDDEEQSS